MIRISDILWSKEFRLPSLVVICIFLALILGEQMVYGIAILLGILQLVFESYERIRRKRFNLDYLAFLALGTALILGQLLAGAVVALMVAVSAALERYGAIRAEQTLRSLFENIPKMVFLVTPSGTHEVSLQAIRKGDILLVRQNEMLAFDGYLVSDRALLNEANLTGEMEPVVYRETAVLKSGAVNVGQVLQMRVLGDFEHSSYRKILSLVEEGKSHPAPMIRLAERYNIFFTFFSLLLSFGAYFFFGEWERFLAVLVIATPCPLLIAAPISFIGGLNKAARKNIIIKSPLILELLAKTKMFFFDKTGTLTLGIPRLKKIELLDRTFSREQVLSIATALEQHSFHPIAKAFVNEHTSYEGELLVAENVEEKIGEGIFGTIAGKEYGIVQTKKNTGSGIVVDLVLSATPVARFSFDDEIKPAVGDVFDYLRNRGYTLGILTGDKKKNADRLFGHFKLPIYAECRPERKTELIKRYQKEGKLVGMVGDGMNDAPALALADIGIVFSGSENSASIEAADVAIFGRDASLMKDAIHIGRRSYHVALQSILIGTGLSTLGMLFAFFGFISPLYGALLQEVIDVIVIVNALRSTY
ncbi:MAG: cadmium-translocating P-type ATPase [Candidatus Moranbacteria bacterium CG_4_10_14_3_um_filter_45_9]|nr:MAG: cadmium-translocating P-type ATPase [Candidatus Moranbacteria bacterium CG_4_10_14_3_um_filter_45_9]PJA85439.1 MAG: cadmium-translocating P-type ATPase [Candidatus Moranbacteria bacterium CG_4_9_14_3_um_filter_45_14]